LSYALELRHAVLYDSSIQFRELKNLLVEAAKDRLFVGLVVVALVLAYAAEIGSPTFNTDAFYEIQFRGLPSRVLPLAGTEWSVYGRYAGEVLRAATWAVYPPSLVLMVGVGLLAVTVTILTGVCGITRPVERAVAVIIVAVFPFFFETFSYFEIRHVVPLAIAIAAAGILVRPAVGLPLLVLAACFYQSGVYFAAVVVLIWAGVEALNNRPCVRLLVEKALMVGAALLLWRIGVAVVGWLYPSYAAQLEIFSRPAGSAAELWFSLKLHAAAMLSFFTEGVFLFPLRAKLVAVAGILLVAIGGWRLVRRGEVSPGRYAFALTMIVLMPAAAHGANLILYPPYASLFERVLFSYAAVFLGIFVLALHANRGWLRGTVVGLFAFAALTFVWQANICHQYMALKNLADIDIASKIADRLKSDSAYRPWIPLVMVGTMKPTEYLAYRSFDLRQRTIGNTIFYSPYEADWSKSRMLMAFMTFAHANTAQQKHGEQIAATMPVWPVSGSAIVKDGLMVVRLK
jgi:hypothetical protein